MNELLPPHTRTGEAERVRALLGNLGALTRGLADRLVQAKVYDDATHGANHQHAALNGHTPTQPLSQLLQMCETLAVVSGPVAVQSGNFAAVEQAAYRLLPELHLWRQAVGRSISPTPVFTWSYAERLQEVLMVTPEIRDQPTELHTALDHIIAVLQQLEQPVAILAPAVVAPRRRRRGAALPVVMFLILAMLLFLVTNVAMASQYKPTTLSGTPTIIITTPTTPTTPTPPPNVTATPPNLTTTPPAAPKVTPVPAGN